MAHRFVGDGWLARLLQDLAIHARIAQHANLRVDFHEQVLLSPDVARLVFEVRGAVAVRVRFEG